MILLPNFEIIDKTDKEISEVDRSYIENELFKIFVKYFKDDK